MKEWRQKVKLLNLRDSNPRHLDPVVSKRTTKTGFKPLGHYNYLPHRQKSKILGNFGLTQVISLLFFRHCQTVSNGYTKHQP